MLLGVLSRLASNCLIVFHVGLKKGEELSVGISGRAVRQHPSQLAAHICSFSFEVGFYALQVGLK